MKDVNVIRAKTHYSRDTTMIVLFIQQGPDPVVFRGLDLGQLHPDPSQYALIYPDNISIILTFISRNKICIGVDLVRFFLKVGSGSTPPGAETLLFRIMSGRTLNFM